MALWYASRAAGLVVLLLVTTTTVLGAVHAGRTSTGRWPRFAMHALHRNLALLSVALLAVHVSTAIIDPYAGIRWLDAVVPFGSTYHPFWLGMGAVALDLLLALVVTSLVRTRLPLRAWRATHLAAYAMWPIGVVHGLGIGGADSTLTWVRVVDGLCVVAVSGALVVRLRAPDADRDARRAAAVDT